jgi:2,5-furandicarboxylate decarboxylase 1
MALALGVEEAALNATLRTREASPVKPEMVESGPVKEVRLTGDDIDLRLLPAFVHHEDDAGPYITGGAMVVRDPETGIRNVGMYRHCITGPRTMGIHLAETGHAYLIYEKHRERELPMPMAITIGHHPSFYLGCLSFQPFGVDEYDVVGGFMQRPLRLVKAETVDLEVPADAEVVIEGYIPAEERAPEGPIGEYSGTYGSQPAAPVVHVTAITMRREPIWLDVFSGHPDHQLLGGTPRLSAIYRMVRIACPGVKEVYMPPSGCCRFICIISMKKRLEGEPKNAACAAFAADTFIRYVIVVDEDVNIFDEAEVLKAIALRTRPDGYFVIPRAKGHPTDPIAEDGYLMTKVAIDATRPLEGYPKEIRVRGADRIKIEDYLPGLPK